MNELVSVLSLCQVPLSALQRSPPRVSSILFGSLPNNQSPPLNHILSVLSVYILTLQYLYHNPDQ